LTKLKRLLPDECVLLFNYCHYYLSTSIFCFLMPEGQNTSSGARAMHGFIAMCLLRRSRCVFLAPRCAALRCPWMSALLVLVVRVLSCARGPPCVFVFYCTCTTNLYYCTVLQVQKERRPRTTNHEIPSSENHSNLFVGNAALL